MVSDELGQGLHDKATRGASLTAQERLQLEEWYRQQDAAESHRLVPAIAENTLATLRSQVTEALTQMQAMAAEIRDLAVSNETLRREVTVLRERLAERPIPQSA